MMQEWFEKAKLGIFIHWGIYAVKPTGESWPFFNGEISYEDYMAQVKSFGAENYDPAAWTGRILIMPLLHPLLTNRLLRSISLLSGARKTGRPGKVS